MDHHEKINALLKRLRLWLAIGLIPLLSSCASNKPPQAVLQRVRQFPPDNDINHLQTRGFLVAYTPLELHFDDSGCPFYRRTGYYVCRPNCDDQSSCTYVPNHLQRTNDTATVVNLPAGPYWIKAQTACGEPFIISIVIRPSVTTTINLEEDRLPPSPLTGELYRVCLNGQKVGWMADSPVTWPGKHFTQ